MYKKFVVILVLALCFIFPFAGCGNGDSRTIKINKNNYEKYFNITDTVISDSYDPNIGKYVEHAFFGSVIGLYDVTIYYEMPAIETENKSSSNSEDIDKPETEKYELHLNDSGYGTYSYLTTRIPVITDVVGVIKLCS